MLVCLNVTEPHIEFEVNPATASVLPAEERLPGVGVGGSGWNILVSLRKLRCLVRTECNVDDFHRRPERGGRDLFPSLLASYFPLGEIAPSLNFASIFSLHSPLSRDRTSNHHTNRFVEPPLVPRSPDILARAGWEG